MKKIGLYIHIPFCKSKCPYCDFYSIKSTKEIFDKYTDKICSELKNWGNKLSRQADTLYLGGGTPSVIGADNIAKIVETAKENFSLKNAEITVECNPSSDFTDFFGKIQRAGVNRISLGLQSAIDEERRLLGRSSGAKDVENVIKKANDAGIYNISLDLMLGTPKQSMESIEKSINFCVNSGAKHVSAYILKIEQSTPFYKLKDKIDFPDEDLVSDFYEKTVALFEKKGFEQYEISNFAVLGFESKHNLKYWNDDEYLGIGPSAHSFVDEKRFYYPSNINEFLDDKLEVVQDGKGGDFEEYAMLRLRLRRGLLEEDVFERFGYSIPKTMYEKAQRFQKLSLLEVNEKGIILNQKGFLLSNYIISELL